MPLQISAGRGPYLLKINSFATRTLAGWFLYSDNSAPWLSEKLQAAHARREDLVFKRAKPTAEECLRLTSRRVSSCSEPSLRSR